MTAMMTQFEVDKLCTRIDEAIRRHTLLELDPKHYASTEIVCNRLGFTAQVIVRLKAHRRRRPTTITGPGTSPDAAVEELIRRLDTWAEAMK